MHLSDARLHLRVHKPGRAPLELSTGLIPILALSDGGSAASPGQLLDFALRGPRFGSERRSVALRGADLQKRTADCRLGRRRGRIRPRPAPICPRHRKSALLRWYERWRGGTPSRKVSPRRRQICCSSGCPGEGNKQDCENPFGGFRGCMRLLTVDKQSVDLIKVQQRLMGNYSDVQMDTCGMIDRWDLKACSHLLVVSFDTINECE